MPEVKAPKELFIHITGFDYYDKNELAARESKVKPKPHLVDRPDGEVVSQFDFEWENSKLTTDKIVTEAENLQLVDTPVA